MSEPERSGTAGSLAIDPPPPPPLLGAEAPALEVAPGARGRMTLRNLFQPSSTPGTDPPPLVASTSTPIAVERWFAFLDISGFTAYCDQRGEHAAIELLTRFRSVTREVVGRRGARVSKWLGDGVMIVGIEPEALVATVAEVVARTEVLGLDTHAGVAGGPVLMFEGDDYVGRPVNRAARLCDRAEKGQVLVTDVARVPAWIDATASEPLALPGIGELDDVHVLQANEEIRALLASSEAEPLR